MVVIYYVATSLDGFIARRDGSVDWLFTEGDYGYSAFYERIDALVMGSKSYKQVLTFGEWPYPGKTSYVFTREGLKTDRDDVVFVSDQPDNFLTQLEAKGYKKIWLMGGAELATSFLRQGRIDEYILSIHPVILGEGIPLVYSSIPQEDLRLMKSKQYPDGLLQVRYQRKQ